MKYFITTLSLFISLSAIAQNDAGYKETYGIEYRVVRDLGRNKPKDGDVVEFNLASSVGGNEFINTYHGWRPRVARFPIQARYADIQWVLPQLGAGDSAVGEIPCDNIIKAIPAEELEEAQRRTPWLQTGNKVEFSISIVSVKPGEQYKRDSTAKQAEIINQRKMKTAKQMETDDKILQDYFHKMKLEPQKTSYGLYYMVHDTGAGPLIKEGQAVSVMYTGRTISGYAYDSNVYDSIGHHGHNPIVLTPGKNEMISGVEQGLKLLHKGSKATFYIPSPLGFGEYGPRGVGTNTILIFDVEVVDVN